MKKLNLILILFISFICVEIIAWSELLSDQKFALFLLPQICFGILPIILIFCVYHLQYGFYKEKSVNYKKKIQAIVISIIIYIFFISLDISIIYENHIITLKFIIFMLFTSVNFIYIFSTFPTQAFTPHHRDMWFLMYPNGIKVFTKKIHNGIFFILFWMILLFKLFYYPYLFRTFLIINFRKYLIILIQLIVYILSIYYIATNIIKLKKYYLLYSNNEVQKLNPLTKIEKFNPYAKLKPITVICILFSLIVFLILGIIMAIKCKLDNIN